MTPETLAEAQCFDLPIVPFWHSVQCRATEQFPNESTRLNRGATPQARLFARFVPTRNTIDRSCGGQFLDPSAFPSDFERLAVGTMVALQLGMRKIAAVVVVAALFASTAAISVKHQRRWTEKLDAALVHTAQEGNNDLVQLLIHVQPGSTDRILLHLEQHGLKAERGSAVDVVAVRAPASMLRSIAGEPEVVQLSHGQ